MATLRDDLTLGHRANTGEAVAEVTLVVGDAVTILSEWSEHYLVRDEQGRVFNLRKEVVEA